MIARTATVVLMLGGLAGTVLLVPDGAAPAPAAPASALPPRFAATHAVLLQLRRAWNPNARRRLLAAALADAEHLAAGVLWVLRRPENELLEPAIVLAGELRLLRTAPQLRALVVRTAERVEGWPDLELAELLADDDTQVVLATLAAVLARNAPPWSVLFELLDHRDPAVRDALVAVVPTILAPALREQLRRIADGFDPLARVAAGEAAAAAPATAAVVTTARRRCPPANRPRHCRRQWTGRNQRTRARQRQRPPPVSPRRLRRCSQPRSRCRSRRWCWRCSARGR